MLIYSQKLSKFPIQHGFSTKSYLNSDHIVFPRQNHTNNVIIADSFAEEDADAIIAYQKNIKIGIKTADCVPILIFEKNKRIVSAVHAGWQGTVKQVLKKTIERIIDRGGQSKHVYACLGPAIGACCYNIPKERANHFDYQFVNHDNGRLFLNLKKANIQQLVDMEVPRENIDSTPWCTSCNNDLFYSYRRDKPLVTQNVSFIELN